MSALTKFLLRPACICVALFFASLAYYANAALNFPVLFNLDNQVNYQATSYIAKHHRIPVVIADDNEIFFNEIGTTRSLRPPFTFIVSAIVANLLEPVVDDSIARQRLGSPVIAAVTVVVMFIGFWLAFKHIGLALLGTTAIGLLPKFVFLASCNNDDIGAILSVSLLFTAVLALIRYPHKNWVLIILAMSVGLVLQTKFTAWLTLPWFGVFSLILLRPVWAKIIKLLPLLLIVCVAAGGWWVIFNMLHYGAGDPTAMRHALELQSSLSDIQPNQRGYASKGIGVSELLSNHDQFLSKSYKSLIGYLEWLDLELGNAIYLFYGAIFLIGIFAVAFHSRAALRKTAYLEPLILLLIISQCWFYLHHNLLRDIQPQARYILPIVMPMMYLFLKALAQVPETAVTLKLRGTEYGFQAISVSMLILACVILHVITMASYIRPMYIPKPFNVILQKPENYRMAEALKVISASDMVYEFSDDKLQLRRTGDAVPELLLDPGFCERLPLNALITLNVSATLKGGFYLRLDHDNRGTYDDLYWRSFPAGQSTAMFTVNSRNCSGAKITLSRRTHQLTLDSLQISELKIHQHGKPI